jgi:hypothetical protein
MTPFVSSAAFVIVGTLQHQARLTIATDSGMTPDI